MEKITVPPSGFIVIPNTQPVGNKLLSKAELWMTLRVMSLGSMKCRRYDLCKAVNMLHHTLAFSNNVH